MQLTDGDDLLKTVIFAPVGICILRVDDLVAEVVNHKFLEIAGKPYEAIHGQFYWDAFPEARPYYEAALASVVQTGEAFHADEVELMVLRHGREEWIFVTFIYSPIKGNDGQVAKISVWVLESTKQVNERQEAEAAKMAFRLERDRLQSFFMAAPAGIRILDGPELVIELVNPAYQELLPGRKLIGRPIFDALPELLGTPLEQVLLDVYRTGETYEVNELLIPVAEYEGGPTVDRYFSFNYQARRDVNGDIDGIMTFVFEVTDMMNVQRDLREARELADQQRRVYETITSNTPDLMYVFGLDYRFTYANSALLTMWGKTWENAVGKSLLENGYEPWHAEMHEREIDHVKATKEPVRGEVAFPHATLGRRVYDYILTPVINAQGEVEAVAGTTRDVTERKNFEEALAKSSDELKATNEEQAASNKELIATNEELARVNKQLLAARKNVDRTEESLRMAIDAAGMGTYYINMIDRIFYPSAKLKEFFGFGPDEEMPYDAAVGQIHSDYREKVASLVEEAITKRATYDTEYPIIARNDGKVRWVRAIGTVQQDNEGINRYFTGMLHEITEQKQDEIRKNDFIGMVSHELKTPLTSLTAIIQVANSRLKNSADPFLAGAMEKANVQVKRMANMINGFLNISRLESAKLLIDKHEFNLDELVEEVIGETSLTLTSHVIKFKPCDHLLVNADRDKIGSVITNLVSNAVKYSPKGKEIEIRCEVIGSNARVSVTDHGMGLKPQDSERVFDRYFRVESNHTQHISGFGIGLYLSAEIIQRHDGEIWVESESGKGSTFYFSLPLG